ncbi:folate receptor family protein [Anaeramoeba flamelloides]|uniref:Folate receptor family protein n=1 Tax=Anaeramoeba flamelloides TaxID=1746091 RepID=A0ABQ8Y1B3_9EUKA|nr:folate receptor family protein [Anaeramoeba flamelloides]
MSSSSTSNEDTDHFNQPNTAYTNNTYTTYDLPQPTYLQPNSVPKIKTRNDYTPLIKKKKLASNDGFQSDQNQKKGIKILIFLFSLIFLVGVITFAIVFTINDDDPDSIGSNHGIGKEGIKCPNRAYYIDKSEKNTYGCCDYYKYSCSNEDTCTKRMDYNRIVNQIDGKCDNLLGLLSCSPMSPYVNSFAQNIDLGKTHQNISICEDFCDHIYSACKSKKFDCTDFNKFPHQNCGKEVSIAYHNAKDFCEKGLFIQLSKDNDHCFSDSGLKIPSFVLIYLAFGILLFIN